MRIIDVLGSVDRSDMADKLMELHPDYFGNKTKEEVLNILNRFFDDVNNTTLKDISNDEEYSDFLVMVNLYYDDCSYKGISIFDISDDSIDRKLNVDEVTKEDLETYFTVDGLHKNELKERHSILDLSFKEYRELSSSDFSKMYITSYGLDFIPREIILACEFADASIKEFGLITCATELFWELTFYGLTAKQVQDAANEMLDRTKDIADECNSKSIEELMEEDMEDDVKEDTDKPEPNKANLEFTEKFYNKVVEFNHNNMFSFMKKVYETL